MASAVPSITCLWLDANVNSPGDNQETQQDLRQILDDFQPFDDTGKCEQYIRKYTDKKIVLIVSGGLGRELIPKIHDLPQLSTFYVFCQNKKLNEEWSQKLPKTGGVFTTRSDLLKQIAEEQQLGTKGEKVLISILNSNSKDLQSRNAEFMWFQLFIEVLLRMHHRSNDRKELIELCKKLYAGNIKQLNILEEFEQNYTSEKAIQWYTRDSCLYRVMNKALREHDYDTLFAFRVFITDIAKQIKNEYEKFIRTEVSRSVITVYRGQLISREELTLMQNSIGEFVSMNSFFSTSRDRLMAIDFARINKKRDNMKTILFEIQINPKLRTKAFADITKMACFKEESEVLIMLGALFRIDNVYEDDDDSIWVANVCLANEDDFQLKEMFTHMKGKIGDDTNLDTLGKLFLRMDENEKARRIYKRMLTETQLTLADAELGFGWASMRCDDNDESLKSFEESLRIRQKYLGENHSSVGESYSFIGEMYRKKHKYREALTELTKAMTIQEKTLPDDSLDLAATYVTIGETYNDMNKYDDALNYFNKALKIRQKKFPDGHPQLAALYTNFGWLHESEEKYPKALEYYEKALGMSQKILKGNHHLITDTKDSIQRVRTKMRH